MIAWAAAVFLVVGFIVLAKRFGLVAMSGAVVAVSRRSLGVICNATLSDDAKEAALRKDAGEMFRLAFLLSLGSAAAILMPTGLLWLCDRFGWLSLDAVWDVAVSPAFLVASCAAVIFPLFIMRRRKSEKAENYSATDRLLHRVAFRTWTAQVGLADLENQLFAKQLASCKVDRPVFITALPRAGTTMLLECCAGMGEFASHCYRDMPFVLIPCLWNRFSASFRRDGKLQERAHGDGMLIDFDSPEALEEVLWKTFWPRHYEQDRIVPWERDEEDSHFREFFRDHIRKIALVRRGDAAAEARYLSKNNLNIARTAMLRRLFPDAIIAVPFREPLQHAESLLKQHRNFLRIHAEDRFASEYMRAIGHFDFGENLRPVDFDGWFDRRQTEQTDVLAFWLEYWAVAYRNLLENDAEHVHFIDYDALCADPECGLRSVAETLGCRDPDALLSAGKRIHAARPRDVDVSSVPESVLSEVRRVYDGLR